MKPTKEQIKEFWEWCGLSQNHWTKVWFVDENTEADPQPILDLNNLFKYAVQDGWEVHFYFDKSAQDCNCIVVVPNEREFEGSGNTYTQALFWALYEVIKK